MNILQTLTLIIVMFAFVKPSYAGLMAVYDPVDFYDTYEDAEMVLEEEFEEDENPFMEVARKGRFPLPKCRGLKNGGGKGHFGASRRNGRKRYRHTGVDYYSPTGTPVKSPWPGTVYASHYSKRAGHMIKIKHTNGLVTVYMHLHKRKVSKGKKVNTGTLIGTVGRSGNARRQAPHLHFEIRTSRGRANPQKYFDCRRASGY